MRYLSSAIAVFSVISLLIGAAPAAAQTAVSGTSAEDCKEYGVDYEKVDGLTQKEILERMDRALYRSLNKYDDCLQRLSAATKTASSGGGAGGGGDAGGGAAGSSGSGSAATSAAASGISGTEQSSASAAGGSSSASAASGQMSGEGAESGTAAGSDSAHSGSAGSQSTVMSGSGKAPEDIPPGDNDTILQQKVREAAMNEPDPERQARLWNEYRKLKGIPER